MMMETIIYPLIGGLLIGLSSTSMLGGLGRITGISGILGSVLTKPSVEHLWRYGFLGGLIGGGVILYAYDSSLFSYSLDFPLEQVIAAGLLVGYGTRLGSGCTSGHGVCGISRIAKRSITATITFIVFGIITVAIKGAL